MVCYDSSIRLVFCADNLLAYTDSMVSWYRAFVIQSRTGELIIVRMGQHTCLCNVGGKFWAW
jgi:hypothetical protein